jgi:hypothetical protein
MANVHTIKGQQIVQNLAIRNNLAVQNELQAKHLIADNVVQANAAHRDYGQLVLGSASKIAGFLNMDTNTVIKDGNGEANDIVLADGTISSSPIMSKRIGAVSLLPTIIDSSLLDPANEDYNQFNNPSDNNPPTWKSSAELASIVAENPSFTPNPLQLEMAKIIDAGTAAKIAVVDLDAMNVELNPFVGTASPVTPSSTWKINSELDALEQAPGSSFMASPLQRAVATAIDYTGIMILTSVLDPTNIALNPFMGLAGSTPSTIWKTNTELDSLENAIGSTFIANPLQRAVATSIDDGTNTIPTSLLDPTYVNLNPFEGVTGSIPDPTWKTNAELDTLENAIGSTFIANPLQRAVATSIDDGTNIISTSLLDPTDIVLNPFMGLAGSATTATWKTNAELDTLENAIGSTFVASPLQRAVATSIDDITNTISVSLLDPTDLNLNPFEGVTGSIPDPTWNTNVELDALEAEVGSTFVASPLQRAVATTIDDIINMVLISLLDPTNVALNPFTGANMLPAPSATWKTNVELDALEGTAGSTFVATSLQRDIATAIKASLSTIIDVPLTIDPADVLLNPFIGTAIPVSSTAWKTNAELDSLQNADGSTFVASILQRDMAIRIEKLSANIVKAPMFDPTNVEVNPFIGVAIPVTELTWKTNSELDALETAISGTVQSPIVSTFKASPLQRDMATMVEQSAKRIAAIDAPSSYLTAYAQWAEGYVSVLTAYNTAYPHWISLYQPWLDSDRSEPEPYKLIYPIVSDENRLAANESVDREIAKWLNSPNASIPESAPMMVSTAFDEPIDLRKSSTALINDYETKLAAYNDLFSIYEYDISVYNVVDLPEYQIEYDAWVADGSNGEPPAEPIAPIAPIAPINHVINGKYTHQFEIIDAAVRKIATVYSFSKDGTMQLVDPLVIHSNGIHRTIIYPMGALVMQGRTRENKFIFSQVADAQIDELIDETNNGHLGDNRRVAIEAGPVISYVKAGPDELDIVPQLVFQNASEKWRVALVPDRTTYEDEYGNIVQGDGLLKLMIQRHLAVPKSVTYNDSTGTPITSNISWETISSFVGNTGAVGVLPSNAPVGYKSS